MKPISVISPIINYRIIIAEQFGASRVQIMQDAGLKEEDFTNQMYSPVISANPTLFQQFDLMTQTALQKLDSETKITQAVQQLIMELLKGETPSLEIIAHQMALSTRSLQAKLKEEHTSFRKILEASRRELAQSYLKEKQANKSEIAYLLGFSEVAVFSRTFKKWTGMTPSEYQRSL